MKQIKEENHHYSSGSEIDEQKNGARRGFLLPGRAERSEPIEKQRRRGTFLRRRRGERVLSVRVPRVDDVGDVFKKRRERVLRRGEKGDGRTESDGRGDFEVGREDFVRVGG